MKDTMYVTTPIYYVNDVPHIGHAYTSIAADVLARYYRIKLGDEKVFLSTGTDEHGAKIAESAEKNKENPKRFADQFVKKFKQTWDACDISYNGFIRTTDAGHEKLVKEWLIKLKQKGFVDKRKYEGMYCIGCEKFISKSEMVDFKCHLHPNRELVKHSEENWYFMLSKFQDSILNAIIKQDIKILPKKRENEIISKIKMGLEDISISRKSVSWGIRIPWDEEQTVYVWIEALMNYYSVLAIHKKTNFWPANIHLMAKDILWFHAVIWPALLLALDIKLPKVIFAHGYFTVNGQKMSKSLGNVLDPVMLAKKYGSDALRYYLLSDFPFGEDGGVSEKQLITKYNGELLNNIGNLANRVAVMCAKWYKVGEQIDEEKSLKINNKQYNQYITNFQFDEAIKMIVKTANTANKFIEKYKPWELVKTGEQQKLNYVLVNAVRAINTIGYYLEPFMPKTAQKIDKQFNKKDLSEIKPEEPLFNKINVE